VSVALESVSALTVERKVAAGSAKGYRKTGDNVDQRDRKQDEEDGVGRASHQQEFNQKGDEDKGRQKMVDQGCARGTGRLDDLHEQQEQPHDDQQIAQREREDA